MLLNHQRQTPRGWDDATPSLCPDCGAELLPRRGRVVVWHWAHRVASSTGGTGCLAGESAWHLAWKAAYYSLPGWEVEVPVQCGGRTYRADAANQRTGRYREFVHSLADGYIDKHLALRAAGLDVAWVFDGEEFAASRRKAVARGGVKHLLKPKARWLYGQVGGMVHFNGRWWSEWRDDVWFPQTTERISGLLKRYAEAIRRAGG